MNDMEYTVVRSQRKTISIHIKPDGSIEVRSPRFVPELLIRSFVQKHADWIQKKRKEHPQLQKKKTDITEGSTILYLGKEYVIQFGLYKNIACRNTVLEFPRVKAFRLKKELVSWYESEAKKVITEHAVYMAKQMQVSYASLYFSDTKSKWGSCSPQNVLQFNWRLIMAPRVVLNYVVTHELAHIKVKNHSRQFWNIVAEYQPSFRQHRLWLKRNGHVLHML